MTPSTAKAAQTKIRKFAIEAARLLADRHCDDVILLDIRGLSEVCDYVLIGTGTSERQMKGVARELHTLATSMGEHAFRSNSDTGGTWIVVDFVDLVAHLFEPSQRAYYDLEDLWSDGKIVKWQRTAAARAPAAKKPTAPKRAARKTRR